MAGFFTPSSSMYNFREALNINPAKNKLSKTFQLHLFNNL